MANEREVREGDELWFGLVGPIHVSDQDTPERRAWNAAKHVAQAAHSWEDLAALVGGHADFRVRHEAIPRLRARFSNDPATLQVLGAASLDDHASVRGAAVMALGDLGSISGDLIAARLYDGDFGVRLAAAQELAYLGDIRAPADPEVWALERWLTDPSHD